MSASRLPGRSGISSVRSSRMRTNPVGSPRGETSTPPPGSFVATQTNGERSTNWRVSAFRRSASFDTTTSPGDADDRAQLGFVGDRPRVGIGKASDPLSHASRPLRCSPPRADADRRDRAPTRRPGSRSQFGKKQATHGIYAEIILLAVILALQGKRDDSDIVSTVLGALLAVILAEAYADYVGTMIGTGRRPTWPELRAQLALTVRVAARRRAADRAAHARRLRASTASTPASPAAKISGIVVIGAYAYVANRRAGPLAAPQRRRRGVPARPRRRARAAQALLPLSATCRTRHGRAGRPRRSPGRAGASTDSLRGRALASAADGASCGTAAVLRGAGRPGFVRAGHHGGSCCGRRRGETVFRGRSAMFDAGGASRGTLVRKAASRGVIATWCSPAARADCSPAQRPSSAAAPDAGASPFAGPRLGDRGSSHARESSPCCLRPRRPAISEASARNRRAFFARTAPGGYRLTRRRPCTARR